MNKLINWFKKQSQDKKDHFYLGLIIGFPLVLAFGLWGGVVGLVLLASKELINDKLLKKGTPDVWDFVASAIPVIMFMLIQIFK